MKKIGIIAALPDEAKCLYQVKLLIASPVEIQKDIYLCLSGIGPEAATTAAEKLFETGVNALISWGVAGALDPDLNAGDLLIADKVKSKDIYSISEDWFSNVNQHLKKTSLSIITGLITSTDTICESINDKAKLYKETDALAVDMESAAIAEVANKNNLDVLIIRAISDDAKTILPDAVSYFTDQLGKPLMPGFLFSCLAKPKQIPALFKLANCYKKALNTLSVSASDLNKHHFLYNV